MNLEQVVHERWAASPELAALLPAERFFCGRVSTGTLPYATLLRRAARRRWPSNSGEEIEEVALRIRVWHTNFEAARLVGRAIGEVFDRSRFPLAGGDCVMHMRRRRESAYQFDDGAWRLTLDFRVYVRVAAEEQA